MCDVGAGTAPFSKRLAKEYKDSSFVAVDTNYEQKELGSFQEGVMLMKEIAEADVYLLNDVLEHLENPKELLSRIRAKSLKGSILVITVPAHMSLWSGHDVYLKHYRRYSMEALNGDLACISCEILEMKFIFNSLFLPAYISRKFLGQGNKSQMRNFNSILNVFFKACIKLDSIFGQKLRFGLSLFAVIKL